MKPRHSSITRAVGRVETHRGICRFIELSANAGPGGVPCRPRLCTDVDVTNLHVYANTRPPILKVPSHIQTYHPRTRACTNDEHTRIDALTATPPPIESFPLCRPIRWRWRRRSGRWRRLQSFPPSAPWPTTPAQPPPGAR